MIAISKSGKSDTTTQTMMRTQPHETSARELRFDGSENNRICRFPSNEHQAREPLEIISERGHMGSRTAGVQGVSGSDGALTVRSIYPERVRFCNAEPPYNCFVRRSPSHRAFRGTSHRSFPVHITQQAREWKGTRPPVSIGTNLASGSYWGWKEHASDDRNSPPSNSVPFPPVNQPGQGVTATISNDEATTPKPTKLSIPSADPSKRQVSPGAHPTFKRQKGQHGLDLLVRASLEMGPMQLNPSGCSCPKSKCVALYCECFKAGRRCDPNICTCSDCKNTITESGPFGARTLAIRGILARNPRAFVTAGTPCQPQKLAPGEVACSCLRSRCLKLYCTCFQQGKACKEGVCSCIGCLNTEADAGGERKHAIKHTLQKRPDAFEKRDKPVGLGCACKNNRCIRKYCECFRNGLACTESCKCSLCENMTAEKAPAKSKDEQQLSVTRESYL